MKYLLVILMLSMSSASLFFSCKTRQIDQTPSKVHPLIVKAQEASKQKNYKKAHQFYNIILDRHPSHMDALLGQSGVFYKQEKWEKAKSNLKRAIDIDPDYNHEMYFSMGLIEEQLEQYKNAAIQFEKYLSLEHVKLKKRKIAIRKQKQCNFIEQSIASPVPLELHPLSDLINTTSSEYYGVMNADNSSFVFTRRVNHQEDLFMSTLAGDTFGIGVPLSFNTDRNEAAHCISSDAKLIILTICDGPRGIGSCDLYYSQFIKNKWTEPKNMGRKINSPFWDAQPSLSHDGKTLYFSSKRKASKGGSDIFISHLGDDRRWSQPVPLSQNINTAKHDESPFIHSDGRTLYFRSKGHPGLGDFDIFYSRLDPLTNEWGEAINIGYPINSTGSDGALTVAYDGKTAYYSTDHFSKERKEKPNLDIVSFELYPEARSTPVTYAKLKISDAKTGKPIQTKVKFYDLNSTKMIQSKSTDEVGQLLVGLVTGTNYMININEAGYSFYSAHLQYKDDSNKTEPFEEHIKLYPIINDIPINPEEIVLQNILFETGMAKLRDQSLLEIENLSIYLKRNPTIKIKIIGHTDNVGSEMDNKKLSTDRARVVYEEIIQKGIQKERIQYEGKGELFPIDDNNTPQGRRKNRRTSFLIL